MAAMVGSLDDIAEAAIPPVTFGPITEYATGQEPESLVVGDLNSDLKPDLAFVNSISDSVSVLLGDGAGGFGVRTDYAAGDYPRSVALGDVNGDTVLDLVVTNDVSPGTVSVLLGNGLGAFGPRNSFPAGDLPFRAALGDMNGDTFLDVVVTNYVLASVSVLLGDGTGTFGAPVSFAAGSYPSPVALGDLNGDTYLDLAVGNVQSARVSVLLGDGEGSFGTRTEFATGEQPVSVVMADLNSDSILDLAVANYDSHSVSVLLGDGTGGFPTQTEFSLLPRLGAVSVAVGDVNGDDLVDLAVANSSWVSIVLGDGTGSFGDVTHISLGGLLSSIALGDFDGDPLVDMAVSGYGAAKSLAVLRNTTGLPGAPTILRNASSGNSAATVSWTPPASDGGSPLTGYVVTPYIGYYPLTPQTFTTTSTSQIVTGLTNGTTYRFRVQAVNAVGRGLYSKVTNPVTPAESVPGAPTIGAALAGDSEATVSWTPPASDGGSPLTGYVVTPYIGYYPLTPRTFSSTATTQIVTGLANGTTYRFRVQAINAVGASGYSKVTNPVLPSG